MKTIKTDFAIIGGGACGIAAALQASEAGVKSIIFDKYTRLGGMTYYGEGMFAVGTKLQREMKLPYTVEDRFVAHMNESKWQANPRLVRAFMEKTADTIEWLEEKGCEFTGVVSFYPGAPFVWHTIKGRPEGKHGSGAPAAYGLLRPLQEKVDADENIEVMLETKITSIIKGDDGKIKGVTAVGKDGEEFMVEAPCVLCATGGYGNDPEMMDQYVKGGKYLIPMFDEGQTGDSLKMAWELGAQKDGTGVTQTFTLVPNEEIITMLQQIAGQPNLWVNLMGERYCDESIVNAFPLAINALVRQPQATAYNIIDADHVKYLEDVGLQYTLGEYFTPGSKLDNPTAELERGEKEGKVIIANTIEELAAKLGCEPEVLAETVDEYNACCDQREDFLFAKPRHYLHQIRKGPFYAIQIRGCMGITEGGIKINHKTEVIDHDYKAIPGLYAGGCAAGGLIGDSYIMITSGGSISFAVNSGRMAGESVAKYLGK